jgi:transposase
MPSPISTDLRQRVIDAYRAGEGSYAEISRRFVVGWASVNRWLRLVREQGSVVPKAHGGGRAALIPDARLDEFKSLVGRHADATLDELVDVVLREMHLNVSHATVSRTCSRARLTRKKKTPYAEEQDSPHVIEETKRFLKEIEGVAPKDLVFGDQMGSNLAMTPTYGRAEIGKRVVEAVPKKRGKNLSTMGAMGHQGLVALLMFEGSFNADRVYEFFQKHLLVNLKRGQVVVLDNARIHKKREAELRALLAEKGCRLVFLPPYSPEWSPIENAWSKVKCQVRKAKARTKEALRQAIEHATSCITPDNSAGWYLNCGYA